MSSDARRNPFASEGFPEALDDPPRKEEGKLVKEHIMYLLADLGFHPSRVVSVTRRHLGQEEGSFHRREDIADQWKLQGMKYLMDRHFSNIEMKRKERALSLSKLRPTPVRDVEIYSCIPGEIVCPNKYEFVRFWHCFKLMDCRNVPLGKDMQQCG